eukprot:TRINITY_DN8933_c0_g1_i1.p1 TRINITY_DN8933_c0_g1~~TRINITY_DN8933_c0_g1_i1.p1  ORF type:complete len:1260 (+),score=500.66 TRINITY_DN8933_c0_g1_i1:503-3781(+)
MSNDMFTGLSFYRDQNYQDIIALVNGQEANRYQSFVVPGNKLWFKFTSSTDNNFWGYKFTVKPIELHIDDKMALNSLNFELANWLLHLLLDDAPKSVKTAYAADFFDAIVWYVIHSKTSAKGRGVELLNRLLLELKNSPSSRVPDFEKLKPLAAPMEEVMQRMAESGQPLESPLLQAIVEVLATADLIKRQAAPIRISDKDLEDEKLEVDLKQVDRLSLRIVSAQYGPTDVTAALQGYVDRYGGSLLVIPSKLSELTCLDYVERQSLVVNWEVVKNVYQQGYLKPHVIKTGEKSFSASRGSPTIIRAEYGWFDRVVELSDLTLHVEQTGSLTSNLALESFVIDSVADSFIRLGGAEGITLTNDKTQSVAHALPLPLPSRRFTFMFWLYIAAGEVGPKTVMLHGLPTLARLQNPQAPSGCMHLLWNENGCLSFTVDITDNTRTVVADQPVKSGEWTHVAGSCDGSSIHLWVNGVALGTRPLGGYMVYPTDPFFFGPPPAGMLSADDVQLVHVQGQLKDMRYYIRALDADFLAGYVASTRPEDSADRFSPLQVRYDEGQQLVPASEVELALKRARDWSPAMDRSLIELYTKIGETEIKRLNVETPSPLMFVDWTSINIPAHFLDGMTLLNRLPVRELRRRFVLLRMVNQKVVRVLPLIDFSQAATSWSLARRLSSLSHLIFFDIKTRPWNAILQATASGQRCQVLINRPRAAKAKEKGDPEGKKSVFGQVYRQLHFQRPASLRTNGRAWSCTYEGEGGTDAGGLFRDSLSNICSDLQSPHVPLFIPCPNSRGFGDNQEKWLPNPSCTSQLHLSMYAFVGKLMGIAIRGRHVLNLDLPSMVWKPLVAQPVTRSDLQAVDALALNALDKIAEIEKECEDEKEAEQTFLELNYTFTTVSTDGREIQLKPDGHNIPVTWQNRQEFVQLVEQYRLNEFKAQVDAIRRGLATIVPIQLLPMFSWQELELMVCGSREIDIDYLRENTKFSRGMDLTDHHVNMLFDVLRAFTHKEKQDFLRFVWGQSRLPYNPADFTQKFDIIPCMYNDDHHLPISHTCFFQLELPRYSSSAVLRKKLLYAISNCHAIDTDYTAENVNWEAE